MISVEKVFDRFVSDEARVNEALENMPPKTKQEKSDAIPLTPITRPSGPAAILFDFAYLKDHTLTPLAQKLFNHRGIIPAEIIDDPPNIKNVIETREGNVVSPPIIEIFKAQAATSSLAD